MNSINYLEKYGPKLIEQGYGVVPIVRGKKYPKEKEWQKIVATKEDIPAWVQKGYFSVGVLCKNTPAVDLDIRDKTLLTWMKNKVFEITGKSLIRVGNAPKAILPFRADQPFQKLASKKFKDPKGVEHQVEVLGDGNQFVAFGTHPETRKGYKWDTPLADIPQSDLPTLNLEQAKKIISIFETECKERKWKPVSGGESLDAPPYQTESTVDPQSFEEWDREQTIDLGRLEISDEDVRATLQNVDPQVLDYSRWLKVGMALYHQFEGVEQGFEMWEEWSSRDPGRFQPEDMPSKWKTFAPEPGCKPITFRSVIKLAKETQKVPSVPRSPEFIALKAKDARTQFRKGAWLFKGVLKQNSIACFFGPPGSFKSYLAMDLAFHCASGLDWHDRKLEKPGKVLYILGEMQEEFFERLDAWEKLKNIDTPEENLHVSNTGITLCDANAAEKVDEVIQQIAEDGEPPVLVVIDTINKNFGGDENSASDMSRFLMNIERYIKYRYGCAVLLVHHTGHSNTDRGRGSSALLGGLDAEYKFNRPSRSKNKVCLTCTKTRGRDDFKEAWFEGETVHLGIDKEFETISNLVFKLIPKCETRETAAPSKTTEKLLELIKILSDTEGNINRKKLIADSFSSGIATSKTQFWSKMKSLKDQGILEYKKGNSPIRINSGVIQGGNSSPRGRVSII